MEDNRLNITDMDMENNQVNTAAKKSAEVISETAEDGSTRSGLDIPSPDDITGGYLLERDYGGKYGEAVSKFTTTKGESYVVKSPEYASIDEVNYIADKFQELDDRVTVADDDLSDLIDIESFADKYLLEEFSRNDAAGSTSSYFYKDSDRIDPLIYAGPPWDYDKTFGENGSNILKQTNTLNFLTTHAGRTLLFYNLYKNNSDFLSKVKADYADKLRPYLEELIKEDGIIDELSELVENDNEMDAERWGFGRKLPYEWRESIKDYIDKRMEFTDKIWIDEEEVHTLYFPRNRENNSLYIGILDGDTLEYMPYDYASKGNVDYWYDADTGEKIDSTTAIHSDMTILAKAKEETGEEATEEVTKEAEE